jgi:hypothetical protein
VSKANALFLSDVKENEENLTGQACATSLLELKNKGLTPNGGMGGEWYLENGESIKSGKQGFTKLILPNPTI